MPAPPAYTDPSWPRDQWGNPVPRPLDPRADSISHYVVKGPKRWIDGQWVEPEMASPPTPPTPPSAPTVTPPTAYQLGNVSLSREQVKARVRAVALYQGHRITYDDLMAVERSADPLAALSAIERSQPGTAAYQHAQAASAEARQRRWDHWREQLDPDNPRSHAMDNQVGSARREKLRAEWADEQQPPSWFE
jgi:hypothetical protein